jgi:hypothetical protein
MIAMIFVHVYAAIWVKRHGARHGLWHGHPRLGQAAPPGVVPPGNGQMSGKS